MTDVSHSAMIIYEKELIEVAFFISKNVDVAGTEETFGKEKMPKGRRNC